MDTSKNSKKYKKFLSPEEAELIDQEKTYNGTCIRYEDEKGFGFLSIDGNIIDMDAWVHVSNINTNDTADPTDARLVPNQRCSFQLQTKKISEDPSKYKLSAANVVPGERPIKTTDPRLTGICTRFNKTKGFGFLVTNKSSETGQLRVYVHKDQIWGKELLKVGQRANFTLKRGEGGRLKATRVKLEKFQPDPRSLQIRKGVIQSLFVKKSFGFVKEKGTEKNYFFHFENIDETKNKIPPAEGQEVDFRVRKKIGFENSDKEEAFEVVLGDIKILRGHFKVIREKEKNGIIKKVVKNKGSKAKTYFFSFSDIVKNKNGSAERISIGQPCEFCLKTVKNKNRAVKVVPKLFEAEDKDYLGYEPYLPEHYKKIEILKKKWKENKDDKTNNAKEPNKIDKINKINKINEKNRTDKTKQINENGKKPNTKNNNNDKNDSKKKVLNWDKNHIKNGIQSGTNGDRKIKETNEIFGKKGTKEIKQNPKDILNATKKRPSAFKNEIKDDSEEDINIGIENDIKSAEQLKNPLGMTPKLRRRKDKKKTRTNTKSKSKSQRKKREKIGILLRFVRWVKSWCHWN